MAEIKITTSVGDHELVASGSLMAHGDQPITFHVADLTFIIEFKITDDKKTRVDAGERTEKTSRWSLVNFDSPLGSYWWNDIAIVSSRKLRISL